MSFVGFLISSTSKFHNHRAAGWCVAAAWLGAILVGLKLLVDFDLTPGASGCPPGACPVAIEGATGPARPVLMMFVHSRCPCSRASLDELQTLVEARPGAAHVRIYFRTAGPAPSDWRETSLAKAASRISGANLLADPDGEIASRLGVHTSGHVLVYGARRELLFSGGITAARGHSGDNPGRAAVLELLAGRSTTETQHSVFGCPLVDPTTPSPVNATCPVHK